MGNPFGRPGEVATQRAILEEALLLAERSDEAGVLADLPHEWGAPLDTTLDTAQEAGSQEPG